MNENDEKLKSGESFHAGETPVDNPSLAGGGEARSGSILDLIQKGGDDVVEFMPESGDVDLDALEGDSLQDVFRTGGKSDSSWKHETHKEGEIPPDVDTESDDGGEGTMPGRKRGAFKFIACLVIAGTLGVGMALYSLLSRPDSEDLATALGVSSIKRMRIPAKASDSSLARYYALALRALSNKKNKDAEFILKQLDKCGWRKWLVWGALGECALDSAEKKKARKFLEDALTNAPSSLSGDDRIYLVRFSALLASMLKKEGNYKRMAAVLTRVEKYLGNDDGKVWALLAEARYNTSEKEGALQAMDHVKLSEMTKEQMWLYASLLEDVGRRKDAFGAYLSLARGMGEDSAFDNAETLAPDIDSRIAVLMEAAARRKGTPEGEGSMVKAGKLLLESGRVKDALSILIGVDARRLEHDDSLVFLNLLPLVKSSHALVGKCHVLISKYYSRNIQIQKQLRDELLRHGAADLCRSFFLEEWRRRPNTAETNYMRALVEPTLDGKIRYLKKTLELNPQMYDALFDYGICLLEKGDLRGAETQFERCVAARPMDRGARRYLAIVKMRGSRSATPLRKYERFLKRSGISSEEIAKDMVLLARCLPHGAEERRWLAVADKFPGLSEFVRIERLRSKLVRGDLTDKDFKGLDLDGEVRKLYMIYLVGEGRLKELLLLPTKKEDFPEFWKVYAARKMGLESWRKNAKLIIAKRPGNVLETTCAKLWLGDITPEEAGKLVDTVPYEDKPLLLAMMADRLRALRRWNQVGKAFAKALQYGNPNLYVKVIRRIMNH